MRWVARLAAGLVLGAAVASMALASTAGPAGATAARPAQSGDVSRDEAIQQLDVVRVSIDETLDLIKNGQVDEALSEARDGYLSHFEYVEVPLRVADAELTSDAETKFAEIRGLIGAGASTASIRTEIIELRSLIDDAERKLTDEGLGAPALVTSQAFLIIFREGLEAVLLVTVLLGYLEAAKATQYTRAVLGGIAAAAVATVATFFLLRTVLAQIPAGREVVEAITALLAVAVLFYVSFWLITRLEQKRWLEFLRARVWKAVSVGSTFALAMVGFTAVYREGFETALFYQALLSFGPGLGPWVALGFSAGVAALALVAVLIFRMGRRVPITRFLGYAVILLMVTSVAFIGNAIRALQEADIVALTRWPDWPRLPIFLSQALGYWPSRETILAQVTLASIYTLGAAYVFVIRPRRSGPKPKPVPVPSSDPDGDVDAIDDSRTPAAVGP